MPYGEAYIGFTSAEPYNSFYTSFGVATRVQHSKRAEYLFNTKDKSKTFQTALYTQYTQLHVAPDVNLKVLMKEVLAKYWDEAKVREIFPTGRIPIVYKKGRSLGSKLVSAKHGHDA